MGTLWNKLKQLTFIEIIVLLVIAMLLFAVVAGPNHDKDIVLEDGQIVTDYDMSCKGGYLFQGIDYPQQVFNKEGTVVSCILVDRKNNSNL